MKAFRGFFMWTCFFFSSSFLASDCFLWSTRERRGQQSRLTTKTGILRPSFGAKWKFTHELLRELMSLWEDSCLTLGVTMAGCGMPVVCKLWWGGTMCGGNLEDRRLCKSSEWTRVKWGDGAHVYTRLKGAEFHFCRSMTRKKSSFSFFNRNGIGL